MPHIFTQPGQGVLWPFALAPATRLQYERRRETYQHSSEADDDRTGTTCDSC